MLPAFNDDGFLPAADYELTLAELRVSLLVTGGAPVIAGWDSGWRAKLVDNLQVLARQLWAVGVSEVFIDGSFVEDKLHPNDIDGYFVCDAKQLQRLQVQLNLLDPHKVWTWDRASRRPYRGYPKRQLPMWHQYRVELWPHYGQFSGITDAWGHDLEFPAAFRRSRRDSKPKGIIRLIGDGS